MKTGMRWGIIPKFGMQKPIKIRKADITTGSVNSDEEQQ